MSARIKEKVLRVPCERVGVEDPWVFADEHERDFPYGEAYPHFEVAPTVRGFIDYVLDARISPHVDSYGKIRNLTPSERRKYTPAFQKLFPGIDMDDVRFVEFCWYDGIEAPDYY